MGQLKLPGGSTVEYDPTLDDLGFHLQRKGIGGTRALHLPDEKWMREWNHRFTAPRRGLQPVRHVHIA